MIKEKPKLSLSEWSLYWLLTNPVMFCECLIPGDETTFYQPHKWTKECKCIKIRPYQYSVLGYDFLVVDDDTKSKQANADAKRAVGELWAIGGRKWGKSAACIEFNLLQDIIANDNQKSLLMAYDLKHLKQRIETVISFVESHPFFKIFKLKNASRDTVRRSPYNILTQNGHELSGEIEGQKDPGKSFHGHHVHRRYYEELGHFTSEGWIQQIDSVADEGSIDIGSGVPTGHRDRPMHDVYTSLDKVKNRIIYAEWVTPYWNEKIKQKRISEYKGEQSFGYKTNVCAEEGELAAGTWNMSDILSCMSPRPVKRFEINQKNFAHYKVFTILDTRNCKGLITCAYDYGETAPCEILIFEQNEKKQKLLYRVTCIGLNLKQNTEVIRWICKEVDFGLLAGDSTEAGGRSILADLIPLFGERIVKCGFNEKIAIGYEKDDAGNFIYEKGKPLEKQEYMKEWATLLLRDRFANGHFNLPPCEDTRQEFNCEISIVRGTRIVYASSSTNHIISAYRVAAIAWFLREGLPAIGNDTKYGYTGAWI